MPPIKFRERLTKFMISISLSEKTYDIFMISISVSKPSLGITWMVGDWHPFLVVLGQAYRDLTGGFLLLRNFSVAISVGLHVNAFS